MDVELKPCPFCGGEAILREESDYNLVGDNSDFHVECTYCQVSTVRFGNVNVAIEYWNRRVEDGL